jgi:hypothetical protein
MFEKDGGSTRSETRGGANEGVTVHGFDVLIGSVVFSLKEVRIVPLFRAV